MTLSITRIVNITGNYCKRITDSSVKPQIQFRNLTMCNSADIISVNEWDKKCRQLAPSLNSKKYKGQDGRVAVFGGSLEYTGAPYFSAISALRVGADLVHVFCPKDAGLVIKSYSPELIVHPLLDDKDAIDKIEPWLDRFHVVLIGPGLGREQSTFNIIRRVIDMCRARTKPLIIDADGLFFIANNKDILRSYPSPGAILTPNAMEYARLLGSNNPKNMDETMVQNLFNSWGDHVVLLVKGEEDLIIDKTKRFKVPPGGSGRRCGGQGDLLGGALATFYGWTLQQKVDPTHTHDDRVFVACYAACRLIKECNARMFQKKGRSMIATDMIDEIHPVFEDLFEKKC